MLKTWKEEEEAVEQVRSKRHTIKQVSIAIEQLGGKQAAL
jgi:hypothetical protein